MNSIKSFFNRTPWTQKELLQLLVLFVAIEIFAKLIVQNYFRYLFGNELYAGTLTGFVMSLLFLGSVYVIALRPQQLSWREVGLSKFSPRYGWPIAGWTIVLIAASIAVVLIMEFFGVGTANSKTESLQSQMTPFHLLIAFLSASIISPVYEEIFYRGFLYRWLRGRGGVVLGMLGSSFIFTIAHIPTFNVMPATFVGGLVFSWVYEKTGSVWPGIIIHATFNSIALLVTAVS